MHVWPTFQLLLRPCAQMHTQLRMSTRTHMLACPCVVRKRRNIEFTVPVIDISFVVTAPMPRVAHTPFRDQFWTFLSPFSRDLWCVALLAGAAAAQGGEEGGCTKG